MMPCTNKMMGVGDIITVLSKCFHSSQHIKNNYLNRIPTHHLENCLVIRRKTKNINRHDQVGIIFYGDNHPNVEHNAVERNSAIVTKCP